MKVRVVVRIANCAAVSEPAMAVYCTRLALSHSGGYGLPDVVLLSEVAPVDVALVAGHHAPDVSVIQHGRKGSPEAGVAVASRLPLRTVRPVIGSPATREGGGIRSRPLTGGRIGRLRVWSGHAPPPRSPIARALYIARARACRGLVGCDFNQRPDWMRRTSLRKYRATNGSVLGLLVPRWLKASPATAVDIGSDHPAQDVVVWMPRRLLTSA